MVVGWLVDFGFWLWLSVVVMPVEDCGGCRGGLWAMVVVVCYRRWWWWVVLYILLFGVFFFFLM